MEREFGIFLTMIVFLGLLSVLANALVAKWSSPVGIVVESTQVNVYWDSNDFEPVTGMDFGKVTKGEQTLYRYLRVRNEGTGPVYVYWSSTLGSTTDKISDSWFYNGSRIPAGQYLTDDYRITLSQDIPIGTYNWTIYVWTT